jgi:N6-adenine-specific methylase
LNSKLENKFDLIFLDPPYKEQKINLIIEKIKENMVLKENGIMIIHRHKKDNLKISKKINILDERIYGISKITIGN